MLSNPIDRVLIVNAAFLLSGLALMLATSTFWEAIMAAHRAETER